MNSFPNQFVLSNMLGIPLDPATHAKCDAHDPRVWVSHEVAKQACGSDEFPGFVFTADDPYFLIDLDKCYVDNVWTPFALDIHGRFPGCYVEVSKSGKGLHIIGRYDQRPEHKCKNAKAGIELYTEKRMVAITGGSAGGDPNTFVNGALKTVINEYLPVPTSTPPVGPPSDPLSVLPDEEIIQRALNCRSGAVFGGKAGFSDIWNVNVDILSKSYPPFKDTPYDYSMADAALCSHLAFWTGRNAEQMERIFNMSELGKRDKWQQREAYRDSTITNAIGKCSQIYTPRSVHTQEASGTETTPTAETEPDASGISVKTGYQLYAPEQQVEVFAGCTYIASIHKILTPNGVLMKPDVFKAMYGGKVFMMDSIGKKTTTNAWTAFTESQAVGFPQAHSICFRPDMKPNSIINDEGIDTVNFYVPIKTPQKDGDIAPFLNHVNAMLPNERDAAILISYIAAVLQYPGEKFQWAPLLQGFKGNGKTLVIRALEYAVGKRYTHLPDAEELVQNKFNWWLFGKLFIGVEEIRVGDKWELINKLKSYITNERREIQGKGQDQITGDNRANFLFCSNYKDGLPVDRRYCILYTIQQTEQDIIDRGWKNTRYFPELYNWAKKDGYAIINRWLRNYDIPDEFNPTGICQWAPTTSSTATATKITRTRIEQEVSEAIEENLPGFRGGWISSKALGRLLEQKRLRVSLNKRSELLKSMGYIKHPGLPGGRANMNIIQEDGRPRLYVGKTRTELLGITDTVVEQYKIAQGYGG